MMIKVDCGHGATLTIEHTPSCSKRYLVTMKAGSATVMAQATDALFLNGLLSTDCGVIYWLNDETDVAAVKQFIKDTEK